MTRGATQGERSSDREVFPLPRRGQKAVYFFTAAQNNTPLHAACWDNLHALAREDGAKIIVSRFTYAVDSAASIGQKVGTKTPKTAKERRDATEVWDRRLEPFIEDRSIEIAPGLVWCGELQILPTAVNPLRGLESYTGRDSSIIPHPKFALSCVASPKGRGTKFLYTTGAVTERHYIQKSAGQKASFHHGFGALLVEVTHTGEWFARQLNADGEGVIYDFDRRAAKGRVTVDHRPVALVWGDIHARQLQPAMLALGWGPGGILDTLRPHHQVLHDVLDFRSQNHHERKDPWRVFEKHVAGQTNVADEIAEVAAFLEAADRSWCDTLIVKSNHDEALERWLKEADYREDPGNAEAYLRLASEAYAAMARQDDTFYPLAWAVAQAASRRHRGVRWLARDEEYVVCPDAHAGIELGMHGDIGLNGSRGTLIQFARTGRKCIVAHSHTAGIMEGAYQVGVMGNLEMGYNTGQSSWSHTNAIVYPNGKRALFTIWKGKWRA